MQRLTMKLWNSDPKHPHQPRLGLPKSSSVTGFLEVLTGLENCNATIGLYAMQIRYVLWCGKKSHHVPHEKISTPRLLPWLDLNDTLTPSQAPSGPRSTANGAGNTGGNDFKRIKKSCESFHMFIALWPLILSGQVTRETTVSRLHVLGKKLMMRTSFWIFKLLGDTYGPSRGPLEKEGIGVALLKGVTKTPSCMRNVLGDLMTPAVLFVALDSRKYI